VARNCALQRSLNRFVWRYVGVGTVDKQLTKSKEITDTEYALISIYANDVVRVFATSANMGPMWGRPEVQKFLQRQGSTADLRLYNAQSGAETALNNFARYDAGTDTIDQMWAQLDQIRKVRITLLDAEAEQLNRIRARLAGTHGMAFPFYAPRSSALTHVRFSLLACAWSTSGIQPMQATKPVLFQMTPEYEQWLLRQQQQQLPLHSVGAPGTWTHATVRPSPTLFPLPPGGLLPPQRPGPNDAAFSAFPGLGGLIGMVGTGAAGSSANSGLSGLAGVGPLGPAAEGNSGGGAGGSGVYEDYSENGAYHGEGGGSGSGMS
jgi:hypothetical protein